MSMEFGIFFREDVARDGSLLVEQGPRAGSINILDLRAGKLLRTIEGPAEASLAGIIAPDGHRLLFFGIEKRTRKAASCQVDVGEGRFVGPFPSPSVMANYRADGRRIAGVRHVPIPGTREWKYEVVIVNPESGDPLFAFGKWQARPNLLKLTFLADGRLLSADTTALTIWDAEDSSPIRSIPIDRETDDVTFSADLKFALAIHRAPGPWKDPVPPDTSAVRVYEIDSGRLVRTWRGPWPPR
jgi:hypothetical protein